MSCSKKSTVEDMIKKGLVEGPRLDISGRSEKLYDYIKGITDLAKSKYQVDMGPLFRVRTREVGQGLSRDNETSIQRLEANTLAFEAIDRSKQMEENERDEEIRLLKLEALQNRGTLSDESEIVDGEVLPPTFNQPQGYPEINVQC